MKLVSPQIRLKIKNAKGSHALDSKAPRHVLYSAEKDDEMKTMNRKFLHP